MNEKERELDNSWSTGAFILPLFFLAGGRAAGGLMQPAAINHNKRTCKFFPRFIYFYSRLHNGMVYATRPLSPTLLLLLLLFSYRHDASINYSADEQLIMYTTYRVLRREESRCCCTRRYPAGSWRAENIIQSFSFYPLDMRDAMGEKEKRREERESHSRMELSSFVAKVALEWLDPFCALPLTAPGAVQCSQHPSHTHALSFSILLCS